MAQEAPDAEKVESVEAPAGGGPGRLLGIVALVVSMGVGGVGGYFGVSRFAPARRAVPAKAESVEKKKASESAPLYLIENLVVNPAGTKGARFLIVTVALQPKKAETEEELKRLEPELRDAYGHLLGNMTVEDISDNTKRDALKEQLRAATETVVGSKAIDAVFLPQFVLQ